MDFSSDYNREHNAYVESIVHKYYPEVIKSTFLAMLNVPLDCIQESLTELLVFVFSANRLGKDWLAYGLTIIPHDVLTEVEKR